MSNDKSKGRAKKRSSKAKRGGQGPSSAKRWIRRLLGLGGVGVVAAGALWVAVHQVPWLGPFVADGLRSVLGPRAVAWMEDVAYGFQDDFNQWRHKDSQPVKLWAEPSPAIASPPELKASNAPEGPAAPVFSMQSFEPPFPKVAGELDGRWQPVVDPGRPDETRVFRTLVHPDKRRAFAGLAIVAVDLRAYQLQLVAGTREPVSHRVHPKERKGLIPDDDQARLFAAFNGGFKAVHGHYGMMLGGKEFLPPRGFACTFVRYQDGTFDIGVWSDLAEGKSRMSYYRQTPPCLVHGGELHKQLHYHEYAKGWGATVSGDTVIRRSAIGLDRSRKILFYGLGEAMTAQAIARGMRVAGADAVAELDVNHSYPKFLFYERDAESGKLLAKRAIIDALEYQPNRYVELPSRRDFFYLARREPQASR